MNKDELQKLVRKLKEIPVEEWATLITPATRRGAGWSNYETEIDGLRVYMFQTHKEGFFGQRTEYTLQVSNDGYNIIKLEGSKGPAREIFEHVEKIVRDYEERQKQARIGEGQERLKRIVR